MKSTYRNYRRFKTSVIRDISVFGQSGNNTNIYIYMYIYFLYIYSYIFTYIYIYINIYAYMYLCVLGKYRDILDYGFFRPFLVSVCTFHGDHFGIDGI